MAKGRKKKAKRHGSFRRGHPFSTSGGASPSQQARIASLSASLGSMNDSSLILLADTADPSLLVLSSLAWKELQRRRTHV
jgi:hypothetical protein